MEGTILLKFYQPGQSPGDSSSGAPRAGSPVLKETWGEKRSEDGSEVIEADRVAQVRRAVWRIRRLGFEAMNQTWWMIDEFGQRWDVRSVVNVGNAKVKLDVLCEHVVT